VAGCAPAAALLVVLIGLILGAVWIDRPAMEAPSVGPTATGLQTPETSLMVPRVVPSPTHDAWCAVVGQSCWYGENWGKP
jgi:hypothetical protein